MANIEKRTSQAGLISYRVLIRLKGYPAQSATFKRITDAKRWELQTEAAIKEGRYFQITEAKKHTFNELVSRYCAEILPGYNLKEQQNRSHKLAWWAHVMGDCLLEDITPALLTEHKAKLSQSPATVDKYLKNLSHAFSVAVDDWAWLDSNPVKKVKSPKLPRGRVRFLDDDERGRLLKACKESSNAWLYLCVVLALSSGMRQSRIDGLEVGGCES